jgi:hypothetical protein
VRLAGYHAACDIVGLGKFNEDHLWLSTLCAIEIEMNGSGKVNHIPEPRASIKKLLKAAKVSLPDFRVRG